MENDGWTSPHCTQNSHSEGVVGQWLEGGDGCGGFSWSFSHTSHQSPTSHDLYLHSSPRSGTIRLISPTEGDGIL